MPTSSDKPLHLPPFLRWMQRRNFPNKLGVCERIFGRNLAPYGVVWVRTAVGPVWKLDLANVTHRWIVYGDYEGPGLWNWIRARSESIRTVVDSGANIGQTVLTFAALAPRARIFAYEPGSAARAWLTECVNASRLSAISVEPTGLGETAGTACLSGENFDERHGSWNRVNPSEGEPITIATLDGELDRHGIDTLDFWKLDMEGYEFQALQGAARALAARRIRALYVEVGGEAGEPALTYLRSHGYSVQKLTASGGLTEWQSSVDYASALCLPPN